MKKIKAKKKVVKKPKNDVFRKDKDTYCRKCEKILSNMHFFTATDPLDSNGRMSVCRDCCNAIYDSHFSSCVNVEKALLLTCEDLNVRFSRDAITQTLSQIDTTKEKKRQVNGKIFGLYKSKLNSLVGKNEQITLFRFKDSTAYEKHKQAEEVCPSEIIDSKLSLFWGNKFTIEDIEYLELELNNWKASHKCDNNSELVLMKEIVIKQLEIRKKRNNKESVTHDLKDLQDLMKTASVDPAKANVASAGKSHEAYGMWIKDIEELTPAEWFDQQEKYKDMEGFGLYLENYVTRPIRNLFTGVRDFVLKDGTNIEIEDIEGDE